MLLLLADGYFELSGSLYFGEYPIYRGDSIEIFKIIILTLVYYDNTVMEHKKGRYDPNPLDCSILVLQDRHKSQLMDSSHEPYLSSYLIKI